MYRRRVRRWNGWNDERNSWLMCRDMCHEARSICWYPAQRIWQLIRGVKLPREVRRTAMFDMNLVDLKASLVLTVNDPD